MNQEQKRADPHRTSPPPLALALGWAGVIPFAGLTAFTIFAQPQLAAQSLIALVSYGAIILGFMGGVQWGIEMLSSKDGARPAPGYALSVIPALIAFVATVVAPRLSVLILAAGFGGLLAYDLARARQGLGPQWYAALRLRLSVAVISCLLAAALLGQQVA